MGDGIVRHNKFEQRMSALGQKQTFERLRLMSALPPKADITAAKPRNFDNEFLCTQSSAVVSQVVRQLH